MSDSDDSRTQWPADERRRQAIRRLPRERRTTLDGEAGEPQGTPERRIGHRRIRGERRDESAWLTLTLDAVPSEEPASAVDLLTAATAAREFAQAQYSGFKVGAALETADGRVSTGCNIENATYGLTLCAERVALFKALSEGLVVFTRIVVVADTPDPTPPCGACRQLLWEYCGDIEVILGNTHRVIGRHRLAALLPLPFDRRLLVDRPRHS